MWWKINKEVHWKFKMKYIHVGKLIKVVWGATLKNEMIHLVTLGTLLYCNLYSRGSNSQFRLSRKRNPLRRLFWLLAKERMPQPLLPAWRRTINSQSVVTNRSESHNHFRRCFPLVQSDLISSVHITKFENYDLGSGNPGLFMFHNPFMSCHCRSWTEPRKIQNKKIAFRTVRLWVRE